MATKKGDRYTKLGIPYSYLNPLMPGGNRSSHVLKVFMRV